MTMRGKSIRIYLTDGTPNGIRLAEISNWTGKVIVAPRTQLAGLAKRPEVKRTGIYCLIGPDPDSANRDRIYIGEGDNVLVRLTAHDKDEKKDFWTHVAVVISKDDNLTKSHGRYLESRLIQIAHQADRASLANGNAPPTPSMPEADVADLETFLEHAQMMFPVLGFSFLQPKPVVGVTTMPGNDSAIRFEMKEGDKQACAVEVDDEFVVLKGSPAKKQGHKNWTSYRGLRDELLATGKLVDNGDPDYYVFTEDVAFSSPSAGAAIVAAGNRNGRTYWKVEGTGQTYADWHEAKMASTEGDED